MTFWRATTTLLIALSAALFWGCGGPKVDEKKPLAEIHTEAQKMSSREIGRVAKAYGKAIDLKRKAVDDLRDRLEDMEPEQLASNGATTLKKDADAVAASIASLRERQALYTELLHTKVDPEKPLPDIEAETAGMDAEKIRAVAEAYLQAIYNGRTDVASHQKRLGEMTDEQKQSREARRLTRQIANADATEKALVERLDLYVARLKAKGGDAAGLTVQ